MAIAMCLFAHAAARMQMMGAMLHRVAAAQFGQDVGEGPLKLIEVTYRWETRPAPEVMAEIKAAVAHNPRDIVDHPKRAD
jgi:hypothetical protein